MEILTSLPLFFLPLALFCCQSGLLWGLLRARLRSGSRRPTFLRDFVHSHIFEVSSSKAMHHFVLCITLFAEKPKFVSRDDKEMLFVTLCLCFQVAMAWVLNNILVRIDILKSTKTVKYNLVLRCFGAIKCWTSRRIWINEIAFTTIYGVRWMTEQRLVKALNIIPTSSCLICLSLLIGRALVDHR